MSNQRPELRYGPSAVSVEKRADGSIIVRQPTPLRAYPRSMTDLLDQWAARTPDHVFLAQRDATGRWCEVSYAGARALSRSIAQALIDRGLSSERPVAILSGNGLEHALVGFGAMYAGVPFASISPAYSLISTDFAKLKSIISLLTPGLVVAVSGKPEADEFLKALGAAQVAALGGGSGISLPAGIVTSMAASRAEREFLFYWVALLLAVAVLALIFALLRSRYGLALTAIRDNENAARASGIDVGRVKLVVYVVTAFGTGLAGALIFLQKLRISPDTAFSVNDWTAFVIFIVVIGGIGRVEGPIIGTIVFFALRQWFSDFGSAYLLMLGAIAIVVMLWAPQGIWGWIANKYGWQLLPLERRVVGAPEKGGES